MAVSLKSLLPTLFYKILPKAEGLSRFSSLSATMGQRQKTVVILVLTEGRTVYKNKK
jgi:hypothetical protein